jgi:hypothetical protein
MNRVDTSEFLVHFTKGDNARNDFASIVNSAELRGGTGYIKGNFRCVCFTEAPLHALQDILMHPSDHCFKYAPYGIIVKKTWLFQHGGRPVIYQPDSEFADLPEAAKWRHVRYEPNATPPVDFTWEREWRVQLDSLAVSPDNAWLVVPSVDDLRAVCESHTMAKDLPLELYERLDDFFCLDAEFMGRCWTTILLSNPDCGWSGIDVDFD